MKRFLLLMALALSLSLASSGFAQLGDDFDDNISDTNKWDVDDVQGNGSLSETNQRLEYSVANPTGLDQVDRPWIAGRGPYNADWEVQLDVSNNTHPSGSDDINSFGINVQNADDLDDFLFAELYASSLGGPPERKGFYAELDTNNGNPQFADTDDLSGSNALAGAVRIVFDSFNKVLTTYYATNDHVWIEFGSFGVDNNGGTDGNGNWQMNDDDTFLVEVYGFSGDMVISNGLVSGDNFLTTGFIEGDGQVLDLAVSKFKHPKKVKLKGEPSKPAKISAAIENRGDQEVVIQDMEALQELVSIEVMSLGECTAPAAELQQPKKGFPVIIPANKKVNVEYLITFDCANDPEQGSGAEDFQYIVTVNGEDNDASNNTCPREADEDDKGCGPKDPETNRIGGDILTDVVGEGD